MIKSSILSLDLATCLGWALFRPGHPVIHGWKNIEASHHGAYFFGFETWLYNQVISMEPKYIVYEAPIVSATRNIKVVRRLSGLAAMTDKIGYELDIRTFEMQIQSVKKHWTGNGRADKDKMLEAARWHGYDVEKADEADAIAVLSLFLEHQWHQNLKNELV